MSEYTKGEWKVKEGQDVEIYGGGFRLAVLKGGEIRRNIANARLIAAAPELLHALEDILSGWIYIRETHGDLYGVGWDRSEEKAKQAIAKARGEE